MCTLYYFLTTISIFYKWSKMWFRKYTLSIGARSIGFNKVFKTLNLMKICALYNFVNLGFERVEKNKAEKHDSSRQSLGFDQLFKAFSFLEICTL